MFEALHHVQPILDVDSFAAVRMLNECESALGKEVDASHAGIGRGQYLTLADADCLTTVADFRLDRALLVPPPPP